MDSKNYTEKAAELRRKAAELRQEMAELEKEAQTLARQADIEEVRERLMRLVGHTGVTVAAPVDKSDLDGWRVDIEGLDDSTSVTGSAAVELMRLSREFETAGRRAAAARRDAMGLIQRADRRTRLPYGCRIDYDVDVLVSDYFSNRFRQ